MYNKNKHFQKCARDTLEKIKSKRVFEKGN